MPEPEQKRQFDFSGGHLALDFVNTVSNRPTSERLDRLPDFRDVLCFGFEAGVYAAGDFERLYAIVSSAPGRGKKALQEATQLREALFAIFSAVVERRVVPGNALAVLSAWVRASNDKVRLVHTGRRFQWEWMGMGDDPYSVLWPIARAAAELLTTGDLSRLRICASPDCAWLFLDETRNRRRRWCDMKVCGNRVKARRHYARVKAG